MSEALSITPQPQPMAPGRAGLEVVLAFGQSTLISSYATSPLRLLTPRSRGQSVWAYAASFGGGMVAGDETELDVRLGPGTRCFLGTQASTKIYRNPTQRPCSHVTHASVGSGALLVLAPDPVQAFSASRYNQKQTFELASDGSLVLLDWFTSGRSACGERWEFHDFQSRNEVRTAAPSRLLFLDSLHLSPANMPVAAAHRAGRFNCFATLLLLGPALRNLAESLLAEIDSFPVAPQSQILTSISPVQDGAVLRVAGEQPEMVGRQLHGYLSRLAPLLGDDPWERKW